MSENKGMYNAYYDIQNLTIWGDRVKGQKTPRLAISFRDGMPRIKVYTGLERPISVEFACDYLTFIDALNGIDRAIVNDPGYKEIITSYGSNFDDEGTKTNDKRLKATLYLGKSKEGIIYISMVAEPYKEGEQQIKIAFAFRKSDWHEMLDGLKVPVNQAEESARMARAFSYLVKQAIPTMLVNYTRDRYDHGEYPPYEIKPREGTMPNDKPKEKSESAKVWDAPMDDDIPF